MNYATMVERSVGRPWSEEEDKLLTAAVKRHGEHDNWKTIALSVPGRTNKACRKRWLHSLSPTVRKTAWTAAEDGLLLELYSRHGPKWSTIAREIPGRTDDACSKRYREALDPSLKKDEWTPEEDHQLLELYAQHGGKWGQLGQELQRSGLGCRNRWRLLNRKAFKASQSFVQYPQGSSATASHSAEDEVSQPSMQGSHWPTNHALPEPYPSYPHGEISTIDYRFCEGTSELNTVPVHAAPFQFSSSSLSAALSDPLPTSRPLPHVTVCEPSLSVPPSPPNMHLDAQFYGPSPYQGAFHVHLGQELPRVMQETWSNVQDIRLHVEDDDLSQLSSPADLLSNFFDGWESLLCDSQMVAQTPPWPMDGLDIFNDTADGVPSSLSTPLNYTASISTTSSPCTPSPAQLPPNSAITNSLLFSSDHRTQTPRRTKRSLKSAIKPQGPTRLSSLLTLTSDPSVRPYACGRERCWPADADTSSACFSTSKELFDHSKNDHAGEPPGERAFRCALAGCGKSWKSLNGLQYHLQISTAHFRNALSSSFSSRRSSNSPQQRENARPSSPRSDTSDDPKRTYVCHHPQCFKAYRQPSGLRYHLKHGHPQDMPIQISVVPPALARQIPTKTRKMRRKASIEGAI